MSKLIYQGRKIAIWSIEYGGEYPAFDFFEGLDDSDRTKLIAIFEMLDQMLGGFRNPEKWKKLLEYDGMTFMEFKSFQIRIGCFWQPSYQIYATHGFIKKGQDWPNGEIKKLQQIYKAWKERKGENQ